MPPHKFKVGDKVNWLEIRVDRATGTHSFHLKYGTLLVPQPNSRWSVREMLPGWKYSIDRNYLQEIHILAEDEILWATKKPRSPREAIRKLLEMRGEKSRGIQ